jgi:hypothetical protein
MSGATKPSAMATRLTTLMELLKLTKEGSLVPLAVSSWRLCKHSCAVADRRKALSGQTRWYYSMD